MEIFGQVLRHPLGQRRHKAAIAFGGGVAALLHQIVDLMLDRPDFDGRIDQAGRANDLLGEDAAGLLHLPRPWRRRHRDGLRPHRIPFVEAQRPVVDARRQPEAIFGKRDLATVIARATCPLICADGLVALVDEQQCVLGQIFEQRRGRLAGQSAGQETAVILDARTSPRGRDHLKIELDALLETLRLEQLALGKPAP